MTRYINAAAAFGECLNRQVQLGARIVAASQMLLDNSSENELRSLARSLKTLQQEARAGRKELDQLRRIVTREGRRRIS